MLGQPKGRSRAHPPGSGRAQELTVPIRDAHTHTLSQSKALYCLDGREVKGFSLGWHPAQCVACTPVPGSPALRGGKSSVRWCHHSSAKNEGRTLRPGGGSLSLRFCLARAIPLVILLLQGRVEFFSAAATCKHDHGECWQQGSGWWWAPGPCGAEPRVAFGGPLVCGRARDPVPIAFLLLWGLAALCPGLPAACRGAPSALNPAGSCLSWRWAQRAVP